MTDQEKLSEYKAELRRWEEEYRCYGPRGEVSPGMSAMTKRRIGKLRRAIIGLEILNHSVKLQQRQVQEIINRGGF